MKITDKERRKYLKEIQELLVCSAKERRRFIKEFDGNIDDYISDNPEASIEELRNAMGSPQEIAEGFIANVSPKDVVKRTSFSKTMIVIASLVAIFIIIISVFAVVDNYITNHFVQGKETITYHNMVDEEEKPTP